MRKPSNAVLWEPLPLDVAEWMGAADFEAGITMFDRSQARSAHTRSGFAAEQQ